MQTSKEFHYCKHLFFTLGKQASKELIRRSCLTKREEQLLIMRFINGLTLKECSNYFILEENSVSKALQKSAVKLYKWLQMREEASQIMTLLKLNYD